MDRDRGLGQLASKARDGTPRDVDAFLRALRPLVCRWTLVWTGSPDVAEDVAQRVLLRIHGVLDRFDDRGSAHAWAYRITRNQLIDHERALEREGSLHAELEIDRLVRESGRDASTSLEAEQLLAVLMRELSPRQRAAVDLVDLQGFSGVEAAEMLGIEPPTLRVHLHRARAALKAGYEELHGSERST